jgi:hypothetical protein
MHIRSLTSLSSLVSIAAACLLSGCFAYGESPLTGFVYTGVKYGNTATSTPVGPKTGESCAVSVLGIAAFGDASVDTAAHMGGIASISHVDHKTTSILGIYAEFCTEVHGQ